MCILFNVALEVTENISFSFSNMLHYIITNRLVYLGCLCGIA